MKHESPREDHEKAWRLHAEEDKTAWNDLYKKGYHYVRQRLGKRASTIDIEDVFDKTLDKFYDRIRIGKMNLSVSPKASFEAIVRRKCQELWRSKNTKKRIKFISWEAIKEFFDPKDEEAERADLWEMMQQEDQAFSCFQKLKAGCQKVLIMTIFEKKPHAEIAAEMNIKVGSVKVRKNRCIERLRKCFLGNMPQTTPNPHQKP